MRESIRRELEKERIREEIIAEEMARKRLLEAEVRNELMMEREMAMRSGGGISSPFMHLSLPASHNNLFERKILHRQPIDEKYGRGGHLREIRGFPVSSFQLLGDSLKIKGIPAPFPEDNIKEVIDLGKPSDETQSGTKRKSAPQVSEGSSQHGSDRSKKKVKGEWRCAVCQVSATSERGLNEHFQGKKHHAKEAAQKTGANFGLGVAPKNPIIKQVNLALTTVGLSSSEENESETRKKAVDKTPETSKPSNASDPNEMKKKDEMVGENKRVRFKFWCEMCEVGAFCETVMNAHREGKKHATRLVELYRKGKLDSEASSTESTCERKHKTETTTYPTVIAEKVASDVKPIMDDMEYAAEVVAEENNTMTAGSGFC